MSVEVSPMTANIMIVAFIVEVSAVFIALLVPGNLAPGCPLTNNQAALALALCCVAWFLGIMLAKALARTLGLFISARHRENPLGKVRTLHKFQDQFWQLVVHSSMGVIETYILFGEESSKAWFYDYASMWTPRQQSETSTLWSVLPSNPSVHALYLMQVAIWSVTFFSHLFIEERHKDFLMMSIHHLVTIALLAVSYSMNLVAIGTVVLFLHDTSDIVVDLLKLANYLKLEGVRRGCLVELIFVTNFFTWGFCRLYKFATLILCSGLYGTREILTQPFEPRMESFTAAAGSEYTRGHRPGFKVGDGTFNIWENILALPTHTNIPGYWGMNTLLVILWSMQILWYCLFIRMAYRLLNRQQASDVAREDYEGTSDSEHENEKQD